MKRRSFLLQAVGLLLVPSSVLALEGNGAHARWARAGIYPFVGDPSEGVRSSTLLSHEEREFFLRQYAQFWHKEVFSEPEHPMVHVFEDGMIVDEMISGPRHDRRYHSNFVVGSNDWESSKSRRYFKVDLPDHQRGKVVRSVCVAEVCGNILVLGSRPIGTPPPCIPCCDGTTFHNFAV